MNPVTEKNRQILGGARVIRGTRIPVSRIIHLMARGRSIEDIIETNYPSLSPDMVREALKEVARIVT